MTNTRQSEIVLMELHKKRDPSFVWTNQNEAVLIAIVEKQESLWNKNSESYKHSDKKTYKWMQIGIQIGTSGEECRHRFEDQLLKAYVRETSWKHKNDLASDEWEHLNSFVFLESTIKQREIKDNLSDQLNISENDISLNDIVTESQNLNQNESVQYEDVEYLNEYYVEYIQNADSQTFFVQDLEESQLCGSTTNNSDTNFSKNDSSSNYIPDYHLNVKTNQMPSNSTSNAHQPNETPIKSFYSYLAAETRAMPPSKQEKIKKAVCTAFFDTAFSSD